MVYFQNFFCSFILASVFFSQILFLSCNGEDSRSSDAKPVVDIAWTGDPASIPEKLRTQNPIASLDAVKGGSFRIYSHQFPKSLNYYNDQFSTTAQVFGAMYETLTAYHPVTLDTIPYLARDWKISSDKKKFTFYLDKNAKWSDGKPVTAHDVMFTYKTIMDKKNNTAVFRIGLSRFLEPVILDDTTIEFTAKTIHWNNFHEIAAGFFILPKHAYEGQDFNKINFEFPVVSGPYKLSESKKGRYVKLERRGDWWQRAYPFNKGRYNFDRLVFKVFNEEAIALQAFKKGDMDFFPVYSASVWAKEATGEKFDKNYIAKQRIYNRKPVGFQGWAMNTRREIFKDKRIRKAIGHLIDRKLLIEKLAFGEYEPTNSYYPDFYLGGEKVPNEPTEFNLKKARELFAEAGWKPNSKGILEKNGKEFSFSILDRDKRTEKYFTVFIEKAKEIGVKATIELTDLAGWSARIDKYDFDMTWAAWGGGVFKDPEPQWSSKFAEEQGQPNLPGLKMPDVDKLIELQKQEFDVKKRNDIVRQIDTIVFKEYPYVLLWHVTNVRLLYWQKFGMPVNPLGKYGDESFALDYWWIDPKKDSDLKKATSENKPLEAVSPNVRFQEK